MQRYLVVIVDGSRAMAVRDLLPSRSELLLSSLKHFIGNFFEENPISQLQLILARDGVASIVTPLSGTILSECSFLIPSTRKRPGAPLSPQPVWFCVWRLVFKEQSHSRHLILEVLPSLSTMNILGRYPNTVRVKYW